MNELQVLNHEQTISSREVAGMMEKRHDHLLRDIEKHTKILEKVSEPNFGVADLWQLSSYLDAQGKERKEYLVTKKGCEFLAHKTTGERGDIFTIRYMNRFEEMEQYIKAQTGLKVIDDAHIQTILNAVETQQQEIEEIKSLIGLRSKEVYNYGNQIKKHLGINKISDNPQDYENIKNMFFYELGGYTKWEQIPYSRDNIKLLQEICNDYKPRKTPLWEKYNG
jgi:Rha family phage regulatory protein